MEAQTNSLLKVIKFSEKSEPNKKNIYDYNDFKFILYYFIR